MECIQRVFRLGESAAKLGGIFHVQPNEHRLVVAFGFFVALFPETSEHGAGNASFDAGLRAENPGWGVRDLDEVAALAAAAGRGPAQVTRMPSNKLAVAVVRETR